MTSAKIDINGWPIWYEKYGNGPNVLLLIPGAIGTGRSDFMPQLEGPHAFDQKKYTLIAIELPGWGRSRPPLRPYGIDVYSNDADVALQLMNSLGYKTYSVIGWSDGAKVGVMMTIKCQSRIKCFVAISIFIHATQQTIAPTLATQNTKYWPQPTRDNYLPVYGDSLQQMWDQYIQFCKDFMKTFPGGYWTNDLGKIRCPVLLIHGDQDPLVALEHPIYVNKQISDSQLHRFPNGGHNSHHTYAAEFKKIVEQFFDECDGF